MKLDLKEKACKLRQKGYSFREIGLRIGISKSTASLWSRHQIVTKDGRARLKKLEDDGRERSIKTNRVRRKRILDGIKGKTYQYQNRDYSVYDYKLLLAMLYWGEGAKSGSSLNFINSDPAMIAVYMKLLRLGFNVREEKFRCMIQLHSYHDISKMIDFWSNVTGIAKKNISIYNKENSGKQKRLGYKGCISVRYHDYLLYNEVLSIIERFSIFLT